MRRNRPQKEGKVGGRKSCRGPDTWAVELAAIVKGAIPGLDHVVGRFKPRGSGHKGGIGRLPNEGPFGTYRLGKKMVFALRNQDHAVTVGVIKILVTYDQFRITPPS